MAHFTPSHTPGEGTPYDGQCALLGGLDPHLRAWLDPLGSIFRAWLDSLAMHWRLMASIW